VNTFVLDMELRKLLGKEIATLHEYEEMCDEMTAEEKHELREWIVDGNSVNSNPYTIYEENGTLMDFINAMRLAEEMAANPPPRWPDNRDVELDDEMPF